MLSQTAANFSTLSNDVWFLFSGLNLILGLFICFDSFMFSSCGAFLLPSVSFSSKQWDTSRRTTSSLLDYHSQLHPQLSFRLRWKPMRCPVLCEYSHVYPHTHVHTRVLAYVRVLLNIFLWAAAFGVPPPTPHNYFTTWETFVAVFGGWTAIS